MERRFREGENRSRATISESKKTRRKEKRELAEGQRKRKGGRKTLPNVRKNANRQE